MTKVLLDTHTLLWYRAGDKKLSSKALKRIQKSEISISSITLWEITILISKNKITLEEGVTNFTEGLLTDEFELLTINAPDLELTLQLPPIHKDPFDRLLIAQAINRDLTLITKDQFIHQYPVKTLW